MDHFLGSHPVCTSFSGYLAVELIDSVNEDNAGSYAGWVAAAFMIGRAATACPWGRAADVYGRTSVLYLSLGLSAVGSVAFGLAPTFWMAIVLRFCLGLSNGIMGTIKTAVSEIAAGNEKLESTMMSTVVGFWGWGFLVSPALSGALAEPLRQYPDVEWLQEGLLGGLLGHFPFFLPNLLGAIFCTLSMVTVMFFVRETLPEAKRRSVSLLLPDVRDWIGQQLACFRYQQVPVLKAHDSEQFTLDEEPSMSDEEESTEFKTFAVVENKTTMLSLLSRPQMRTHMAIYWAFSFVGLSVDETFPLFCISKEAGFGLSELKIGRILSLCGLLFAVAQYFATSCVYNRYRLYGSIRMGSILSAPILFLVPFSVLTNRGASEGHVNRVTFVFRAIIMAAYRLFALVFFSNISVAVNRTVSTQERATANGLSVLGGSIAKAIGPIFAGFLVSGSVAAAGPAASVLIFGTIGSLGLVVIALVFWFLREGQEADENPHEPRTEEETVADNPVEAIELTKSAEQT